MSLQELGDRGMTEAALGVDTNNPGGAFQLYTGLGFRLTRYEAVYVKPADPVRGAALSPPAEAQGSGRRPPGGVAAEHGDDAVQDAGPVGHVHARGRRGTG